jgi:PPOX class probable FMN-dependent enzyme
MTVIKTQAELRSRYKTAAGRSVQKVIPKLDKHCRQFISLSPFLVIGSSSANGPADVSPRGEEPGFVHVLDDGHIAIPDRPGNNRLDTFENILENPNVALIFLVPGVDETLRINGRAEIRDDENLRSQFETNGKLPATVLVVAVESAYLHCAKALMRSHLWNPDKINDRTVLPTMGRMINDQIDDVNTKVETQDAMKARYRDNLY